MKARLSDFDLKLAEATKLHRDACQSLISTCDDILADKNDVIDLTDERAKHIAQRVKDHIERKKFV